MSEGAIQKKWKIDGMTMAGIAVAILVLAFAVGFPAWLSNACSVPNEVEYVTPGLFTINGQQPEAARAYRESPPISQFSFGESIATPENKYQRVYGTYYAPKEPNEWGRQFWCEVNASDYFIALFTLVLAAVTGFLWYSTHRLWQAGEKQIGAAIKTANAAEKSAAISEKALNHLEGPIIRPFGMYFSHSDKAGSVSFCFKNFGRSASTIRDVSANILITRANIPMEVQSSIIRAIMYEEMIAPTELSEIISLDDDVLRQYGNNIDNAITDLHLTISFTWEDLSKARRYSSQRFIWSPQRHRFLGGIQLWDDPKRFPPGKTR